MMVHELKLPNRDTVLLKKADKLFNPTAGGCGWAAHKKFVIHLLDTPRRDQYINNPPENYIVLRGIAISG